MHKLTETAAIAIATYGVVLATGANARREFCVAVVGEIVETKAKADDVFDAAKIAAGYEAMETEERALFRKQIQYCRAIADGWSKLGVANQRAFVGGGLPASSAVKLLKAKVAPAAAETPAETPAEGVKVSQPSGSEVISAVEQGLHFATWLDGRDPSTVTETEAKAIADVIASIDAFRAKVADQVRLAA